MSKTLPLTRPSPIVVLLGLFALAVNLRAALAAYPPLLGSIGAELGHSAATGGLVQSGAVLMMAAGSFVGPELGRRAGQERALGAAVGAVAVGGLLRGVPEFGALAAGTMVVGLGIGVAGALLAGVVKEHLDAHAAVVTGGYVVAMMLGATAAGAWSVPMAAALGGWAPALAVWALPAALAAVLWWALTWHADARPAQRRTLPWRDRFTWLAAGLQAGVALVVYGWLTWLAPYYAARGMDAQQAGLLLAVWSAAHIPAALVVPVLVERNRRWRFWSLLVAGCAVTGTAGALVAPEPAVVGPWLWAVLLGTAGGAGFPLGLAAIAWRAPDGAATANGSGLALGVSYAAAGVGPLLMGLLADATGGFAAAIALLLVAALGQVVAILAIGHPVPRRPARAAG